MTEPTDAEIIALADETGTAEGGANGYILPISFARAVLAKWGTPPADEYNQWDALGEDEKIEWALKCADQFRGATKMMQVAQQALDALAQQDKS